MKSMFEMGFTQDLFGTRLSSPMLGQVPMRGSQPRMGEDGDALLRQMSVAEGQVAAANAYISSHPSLEVILAADYEPFQRNMAVIADTASAETNVAMELQATAPGQQYSISESDRQAIQAYITAAAAVTAAIARAESRGAQAVTPPRSGPKTVVTAPANDLTTPLLVGGSLLTLGLIALFFRA